MKRGSYCLLSVGLAFSVLASIQAARHQLVQAASIWPSTRVQPFDNPHLHLGSLLIYLAWVLAIGAAEFLAASRREREPDRPWPVIIMLGVFLYLGLPR